MKRRIMYAVVVFALLVACGAALVEFHPASAHGAVSHTSARVSDGGNIEEVPCGDRTDIVRIYSFSSSPNERCFMNPGEIDNLGIDDVFAVCGGNYYGHITPISSNFDPMYDAFDKGECLPFYN